MVEMSSLSPAKRQLLEKWRLGKAGTAADVIPRRAAQGSVPLSYAQQRFWLLHHLSPESAAFHLPRAYRVRGALDPAALRRSLSEVVRRHEILCTGFEMVDGLPAQVVGPARPFLLPVVSLTALPDAIREAELLRLAAEDARRGFDLAAPPLLRALLLDLGEQEQALLFNVHHLVFDGWSLDLFLRELEAFYTAGAALPAPAVQYADFTLWERQRLAAGTLDGQISYWLEQLAASPPPVRLTPGLAPAMHSPHGAVQGTRFPARAVAGLAEVCREERCTRFMAFLALFVALLHRYTGEEDLLVGTPVVGRGRVELEALLGCFINTLVFRARLEGGSGFRTLLRQVRETMLEAFARQDVPFEVLMERLRTGDPAGEAPILQQLFVYQKAREGAGRFAGAELRPIPSGLSLAMTELTFTVVEDEEGASGFLLHAADRLEATTVQRMVLHLETLLAGIAASPDERLADLPLLSAAERAQLAEWNNTAAARPGPSTVHELFAQQAARSPDAVALTFDGRRLTYGELDRWSNRLAHHLVDLGVGPEVLVAICLERSPELVAGVLAILKAGGAYVSLDPNYPRERLSYLLEDSAAAILLTSSSLREALPGCRGRTVCLDLEQEAILASSPEPLAPRAWPESLVYVVYTSGSTGLPKGALVPHGGIINTGTAHARLYGLGPGDRTLHFFSPSFDAWLFELTLALGSGASLHVEPASGLLPSQELLEILRSERVTYFVMVPSALALLPSGELPDLRVIVTGGEQLPAELVARWSTEGRRFFNAYGPAEASVSATVGACRADGRRPAIGRPIVNARVYLLDRALQPVPVGLAGEICIGGAGLARGYHGRQSITAARFVPDAYSGERGGRLYRSGDLARYLPDGTLEYLGRTDHQVKIRGFRVEPGEVEAVLERHPRVARALVLARQDNLANPRLVAYVVPPAGAGGVSGPELREYARAHLPEPLVPAAFVVLLSLPLTPNGKVDVNALPAPDWGAAEATPYVAPRSEIECTISAVWQEVLGIEKAGMHSSFFDLGGNSLLLVQAYGKLRQRLGEIQLVDMLRHPTLAELAEHLERGRAAASPPALPAVEEEPRDRRDARERLRQSRARRLQA